MIFMSCIDPEITVVIPAQAGIQRPQYSAVSVLYRVVIPAQAGIQREQPLRKLKIFGRHSRAGGNPAMYASRLGSRLRGNDGALDYGALDSRHLFSGRCYTPAECWIDSR